MVGLRRTAVRQRLYRDRQQIFTHYET
jgi:hypothetical protein